MSDNEKDAGQAQQDQMPKKDHNKYRKDKPWDNDPTIDKFNE